MGVRVELAGRLRLVLDGAVIDGRAMGTIAQRLLAALALAGGPVSRDELGDAVWGEALPRTWETALRGAVSKLCRTVGHADATAGDLVRTAFGTYQLDPNVTVDVLDAARLVERAEQALADDPPGAAAAAREAARVLGQPLLAGLESEWVDQERQRLVPLCARAHLALSAAATALGDHVTAVDAARNSVACDPFAEMAHRRLMTALAAAGDRGAALAAYRRCRDLLDVELGVEPSAATDAVRRSLVEDRLPAQRGVVLPTRLPVSLTRDVALAGHAGLLGEIIDCWRGGDGAGCVLVGPAGVGKSRLAAEAASLAHAAGASVIHARIEPDDLGGLGSFAELLGQLDVAWPPPDLASSAAILFDRSVLAGAAVDALRAAASIRRLVVVLDDLHWADRSTAAILEHVLSAEIGDLCVLATAREEWLQPSLSASAELIERLHVIHVPVLNRAGVVDLVVTWAGHRPSDVVLDAIVARTGGNPFYVLAVLQDLIGRGGDLSHGLDLSCDVVSRVPSGVRGIVDAALERIGAEGRQFAEAAAVLGDEFRATTVGAMSGAGSTSLVQHLLNARLIVRSPQDPGRLCWAHALVRDAVLAGVPPPRRRTLHRRAVNVLDGESDDAPAVLRHLLAAAEPTDAARIAELSTVVADDLVDRGLGDEATALLADSLATIEHAPGEITAPLLMALAMAELSMDNVDAGRRHLREAAETAVAVGDVSFLDRWWSAVSSRAVGGTDDELVAIIEQVIGLTEPGSRRRATALGWLTVELAVGSDMRRAHQVGSRALAIARRLGDQTLLRQIVHTWHLAARVEVPAAERRLVIDETLAFRAPAGKRAADALGWVTLAGDCLQLGDGAAAAGAVDAALAATAGFGATHLRWLALRSEVMLATKDGRLDHAERVGEQAAAMAASMPWPDAPSIQVMQPILIRYHQGRLDEMQPFIAAVAEAAPDQVGVLIALAFIESELGHEHAPVAVDDVVRNLPSLTSAAAWLGMTAVVLESMAKVVHPRTAELAAALAPWSGEHAVITTLGYFGAVDRVLGLAAAASGDVEKARTLLQRAITQHETIDSPLYAERIRRELAGLG